MTHDPRLAKRTTTTVTEEYSNPEDLFEDLEEEEGDEAAGRQDEDTQAGS